MEVMVLAICPNCGSWIDEGDICMNCGGSGRRTPDYDDYGSSYSGGGFLEFRTARTKTPYDEAKSLFDKGKYIEAFSALAELDDTYEVCELRGDSCLALNWRRSAIQSYDAALEDAKTSKKCEFNRLEIVARLIASKLIVLMKFKNTQKVIKLYKEYAYVKKSELPVKSGDRNSREYHKLYPLIDEAFEERKRYFGFNDLKLPEIHVDEPPKPVRLRDLFKF